MNTITDHALAGFFPLNEPSGSPVFHNYAPFYGTKPSGLSFDLHVHVTDADTNEPRSVWPGTTSILEVPSGITYRGFLAGGDFTKNLSDGPHERVLILGQGGFASRRLLATPQVAQSGFTVGFWVNPQSNGYSDIALASSNNAGLGQAHALLTKGGATAGFFLGVSGKLANNAVGSDIADFQLRGYAYLQGATAGVSRMLNTPIESGRYTHLTATYRHVDGTNNQWVLYKDGRVEASGTTSQELSDATAVFNDTPFCVGGSLATSDRFDNASGWGHLISGVYIFERPLPEGDILDLHNRGGLQGNGGISISQATLISVNNSNLIAYYPFVSPGFPDASKKHFPLLCEFDEGDEDVYIATTGPFNRGGTQNNQGTSPTFGLIAGSGTMHEFITAISGAGFTIAGWFTPKGTSSYLNNIMCSFGSIGTAETPTLDYHSAGFFVGARTGANTVRPFVKVFNGGNPADALTLLGSDSDIWTNTTSHFALVYDNGSFGVALYANGALQSSGTLSSSFFDHALRLFGSGYPVVFLNGVDNATTDILATNGGQDTAGSELTIFNKPLRQDEINFLSQSGIDLSPLQYTPNDPRLRGYWKCTDSTGNISLVVPDRARVWNRLPANLTRTLPAFSWTTIENSDNRGQFYKVDYFGTSPSIVGALASEGNLGITSGTYAIMGGSAGTHIFVAANSDDRRTSLGDLSLRFKPAVEERDVRQQFAHNEYLLAFELTPSGSIPATYLSEGQEFNSVIFSYGLGGSASSDKLFAYITTINANGSPENAASSGVSIMFVGVDGGLTTSTPLVSGNLKYAAPNKVLFYIKPQQPHYFGTAATVSTLLINLYINGTLIHSRESTVSAARIWTDQAPGGTTDKWLLEFGGYAVNPTFTTQLTNKDTGLGQNFLRNIFIMNGKFSAGDILHLANSGLYDTTDNAAGFDNQQPVTTVTKADSNLQGYYRFTDGPGGSGTKDLSSANNNLTHLAGQVVNSFASADNAGHNLRYLPGPLTTADIAIQASGITYEGNTFTNANAITPFAISGAGFNTPENGFSIGFWYVQRSDISTVDGARIPVSYGLTPNTATNTTDVDAVWAVVIDDTDNIKLMLSKDGRMYIDATSNAAKAGSTECGVNRTLINSFVEDNVIELHRKGLIEPGHLDSWNHYAWTYNPSTKYVKAYFNGVLVDEKFVEGTLNVTTDPTSRLINFLVPMTGVWQWSTNQADVNGILTDFYYFNRELLENEVAFIALNGIADVVTTTASGIIGGYLAGQDTGSGIVGGYLQGIDTASGIIGAFIDAATQASGHVGGYIHGQNTGSGLIGAFIDAANSVSGIIAGFVHGLNIGSGLIGGFINGGLSGRLEFDGTFTVSALSGIDFDSQLQIRKTHFTDFDAKLIVFKEECLPNVNIIIPDRTVSGQAPPFNQYFIGYASGCDGKTIVSTRWSFGDFNPSITGTISGEVFYPIQYRFANSGFYVVRFEAIDSAGIHNSAIRFVHAASGIDPVRIALSGIPQIGTAALNVDFVQNYVTIPPGVAIIASLLTFDDGQSTTFYNPSHDYTEPGYYRPVWCIRDSRGVVFCDSIEPGIDLHKANNQAGLP